MDFGAVGLEGLVGSDTTTTSSSGFGSLAATVSGSDPDTKHKWYGSGFIKQERSYSPADEDEWRSSKLSKTTSMNHSHYKNHTLLKSNTAAPFAGDNGQQQMLSFSCPKSETQNSTLPYFQLTSSAAYNRNTGHNYGNYNTANLYGVYADARGPFTPSQWMELEHQALIYKYITANVPIPSNLLIPIRKALDSAGFSSFSGGLLRPNPLSWGTFHLGFSNNTDPEPGRCRRTDGKKWRCSRDAVADQKYCERHMNRGRHRSRKPVEGQSAHSAAGAAVTTITTTTAKPMSTASSSVSLVGPHSGGIGQHQQQLKNLQPDNSSNLSATGRMFLNKKEKVGERLQDSHGLSMLSSNIDLKSKETPLSISKDSSHIAFGLVNSDSLLNPSHNGSTIINCRNFGSSHDLTDQETVSQRSVRQFMDDWPKSQSDRSAVSWPQLDVQPDRTQLSISIPAGHHTDYMSSTSSPNNEKVNLSPLRLSRDFDPIQMGLGVGSVIDGHNRRQANWIPISWENSMGGPLGEVLHNTSNSASECKSSSALNLMTEGWDSSSHVGSSPTGVLQKTTFGSLSNSSAGSSPRTENNKTSEGASMCTDLLGSSLVHSTSLPALNSTISSKEKFCSFWFGHFHFFMDFGVGGGLEGLVGSSDHETKQEWYGSGFLNKERSGTTGDDQDEWKSSKQSKTNVSTKSNGNTNLFGGNGQQQQQMLSFSCPKSESFSSVERSSQNATLPGFHITSSAYNRSSGYNYGSFNYANMHGFFTEARGPFSPSQWMELEHQALIYKYITANVPVPSNLLIPIKKAFDSLGFSNFSGGLLRANTLPWGAFHLGFSSNTDPEPGRCRRTDGKKWRCSRDAVADQKYCERHMNRGRHRSRKHVEGQSGHSAAAATTITNAKSTPNAALSSASASVPGLKGSGASNNVTIAQNQQQQLKNLQPDGLFNLSAATPLNRMFFSKDSLGERLQDSSSEFILSSDTDLKSKENPIFSPKQNSSYQESSQIEFGHVNSDSLVNPSHNSSSSVSCRDFSTARDGTEQETVPQYSSREFMEGWPKSQSDKFGVSWPQLGVQSDRTQLSISIPIASAEFKFPTYSLNKDKSAVSAPRFLRDNDGIQVPWETSMGGPLGEVLHNGSNSPRLGLSPTGVLQKTTFGSLSNSSAGSSPRAENNRTTEGASLRHDILGSSLMHSSLPAL
ncbi:uncharacterized protein LOC126673818 [Mercurialis annua]|uniref:uncharacterized protein LOC126673818 n=1 Tax=Mercurialis annua TaxID=3986 RepID=UPI0024AFA067|nr:uncharacterized protein LOC126673818 [Mercurialis annua]